MKKSEKLADIQEAINHLYRAQSKIDGIKGEFRGNKRELWSFVLEIQKISSALERIEMLKR